jgi:hypothetical protein
MPSKSTEEIQERVKRSDGNSGGWAMTGILTLAAGAVGAATAAPFAAFAIPVAGAALVISGLFRHDAEKHREQLQNRGAPQPTDDFIPGAAKCLAKFAEPSMGSARSD